MAMRKKKILIINSILIILILIGCWYSYEESLWVKIKSQYIYKIKCDGIRVRVVINDKNQLSKICDLIVFNGIRPVSSFNEAIKLYGEPNNYIPEKDGKQKIEYWFKNSRVDVVRESNANEKVSYSLWSFPNNISCYELLDKEITDRIDNKNEKTIVVITDRNDELIIVITIKGIRVEEIGW